MKRCSLLRNAFGVAFVAAPLLVLMAPTSSAVAAAQTACTGTLTGTISGDLIVPVGATCFLGISAFTLGPPSTFTLAPTSVGGNVLVQRSGSLVMAGVSVTGSVRADTPASINLGNGNTIDGSLEIEGTTGIPIYPAGTTTNYICHTTISGNLQLAGTSAGAPYQIGLLVAPAPFGCIPISVGSSVLIENNAGPISVDSNSIAGNLQCDGNSAITGSGNVVGGFKRGQCVGF